MKKRKLIGALLLIIALMATGVVSAIALQSSMRGSGTNTRDSHGSPDGFGPRGPVGGCLDQLTEEQREALTQMIQELRDAGATREEIAEAVQQYLEDLGIDIEECFRSMDGFGSRGPVGGCLDQLTEEQREALTQMIQELRDAGATHEEIAEAVQQYLEDLGIDTKECHRPMDGIERRGPVGGCLDQLTEEQREALNQMIQELRDAGATHEEIAEAVQQYLGDLGIDTEECHGPVDGFGPRGPVRGCLDQLTEEQREALNQMIQELKDAGAAREEIAEAVQQYLEDLGINTEDCQGIGGHGKKTK